MKRLICVDYSGVYEVYRRSFEQWKLWPSEWGEVSEIEGDYLPNPHIFSRVKEWQAKGAFVAILTGGKDIRTADDWPTDAHPRMVFDDVLYADKRYLGSYYDVMTGLKQQHGSSARFTLVDDSMTNLMVACRANWDAYFYDLGMYRLGPSGVDGECFARVMSQDTVAMGDVVSNNSNAASADSS